MLNSKFVFHAGLPHAYTKKWDVNTRKIRFTSHFQFNQTGRRGKIPPPRNLFMAQPGYPKHHIPYHRLARHQIRDNLRDSHCRRQAPSHHLVSSCIRDVSLLRSVQSSGDCWHGLQVLDRRRLGLTLRRCESRP